MSTSFINTRLIVEESKKIRIDKWLWAIRVFKTRSLATEACKAGRVKINNDRVKASRTVRIGETITIQKGAEKKIVKVVTIIEKRVSATLAVQCYEDFSPPPPPRIKKTNRDIVFYDLPIAQRKRGTGRPTKRERRDLDNFFTDKE